MRNESQILKSSDPQILKSRVFSWSGFARLATWSSPRRRFVRSAAKFPDAHLSYVVEPAALPIVEHNPHLDEVIVAHRLRGAAGLRADFGLIRTLRAGRYDSRSTFMAGLARRC